MANRRYTDDELTRIEAAHRPLNSYQLSERRMVARNGQPTHPVDALHLVLEIERLRAAMTRALDDLRRRDELSAIDGLSAALSGSGAMPERSER